MKKFIVIESGTGDYFIVDSLEVLIEEMYGGRDDFDFEKAKESFNNVYNVIVVEGNDYVIKDFGIN